MEITEFIKRLRRIFDGNFSKRKLFFLILGSLIILLYLGPTLLQWLFGSSADSISKESLQQTLSHRLTEYTSKCASFDCNIQHNPLLPEERQYIHYVGNGYIGLQVTFDSFFKIKSGRTLSLTLPFQPLALLNFEGRNVEEAIITDYITGMVKRVQIFDLQSNGYLEVVSQTYAHRTLPSLFIQDIKIVNPSNTNLFLNIERKAFKEWVTATSRTIKIEHGNSEHDYLVVSGVVKIPGLTSVIAAAVVTLDLPSSLEVKSRLSTTLHLITSIKYSDPVPLSNASEAKAKAEEAAIKVLREAVSGNAKELQMDHSSAWESLWLSGFGISYSKAENAINGDLINATLYNVLSQCRAPLHERETKKESREKLSRHLEYAEGCYGGHTTLQAETLWSKLDSLDGVNNVVSLWLMTLEKQGCHQLLQTGMDGVLQAMMLSFGGFQFSNQHLELNADPSHLHRDYFFRRISYGQKTHLNVTIVVQEDYKAVLNVVLDRSDRNYYGCDAGCLDPPVQLGPHSITFPVKKTEPLTAILYITSDKIHMEELKHTIHVHENAVAPPHEHHVIAVHKHGHKWGGLPALFWLAIAALIIVFHLFLFKLVFNEYCGQETRVKYRKLSDFE